MEWLKKINPFWYILTSLVLICIWGAYSDKFTQEKIVVLLVNIVFVGVGSYGTYLKGELSLQDISQIRQKHFRVHARERYRRLHALFWDIVRISDAIEKSQKIGLSEAERNKTIGVVHGQLKLLNRNVAHCMEAWRDFAPNELEELHDDLLGKSQEG